MLWLLTTFNGFEPNRDTHYYLNTYISITYKSLSTFTVPGLPFDNHLHLSCPYNLQPANRHATIKQLSTVRLLCTYSYSFSFITLSPPGLYHTARNCATQTHSADNYIDRQTDLTCESAPLLSSLQRLH